MKKSVTNEINTLVSLKRGIKLSIIMKSMSASCSVAQSHPTLWNAMDCSTPGFPVLHYLLTLAQTHVHWVSDVFQPSHPLLSPSSPALNLSRHQGLFQWVSSLNQMARVLELQLQHQSVLPMNIHDWFPLGLTGLISLRDSQEFSPTPQYKNINYLALSLLYCPALISVHDCRKNHSFDYMDLCQQSDVSVF